MALKNCVCFMIVMPDGDPIKMTQQSNKIHITIYSINVCFQFDLHMSINPNATNWLKYELFLIHHLTRSLMLFGCVNIFFCLSIPSICPNHVGVSRRICFFTSSLRLLVPHTMHHYSYTNVCVYF